MSKRTAVLLVLVAMRSAMAGQAWAWDDERLCRAAADDDAKTAWDTDWLATQETERASVCGERLSHGVWFEPKDKSAPLDGDLTRQNLDDAVALASAGRNADALLHLRNVERALPRIADRIALERATLLLALDMPKEACEAYALAKQSLDRGVAARAQIGAVQCLIAARDKRAEGALKDLLLHYPLLPQQPQLQYDLALAREAWGTPKNAALLLRRIDLEAPASAAGASARTELLRLAEQGIRVPPFSTAERADRAEKLLRNGPLGAAIAEVAALQSDRSLTPEVRARVQELVTRIARLTGHAAESHALAKTAEKGRAEQHDESVAATPQAAPDPASPEALALARKIRSIRGTKPLAKLSNSQVHALLDLAVAHALRPLCDEMLGAMAVRKSVAPQVRFEAAMRSAGLASDERLAALLATLLEVPSYRISARYHYARALERLGQADAAETQFARVIAEDHGSTPYYAMWAGSRRHNDAVMTVAFDPSRHEPESQPELDAAARRIRAIEVLTPVAERFGSVYPWLYRAIDLAQLERFDDAADELNEVYLAWRDASGALRLRSGLVALLTGKAPARRSVTSLERKGRRALDARSRATLSDAANLLGDPGIALRFGTWNYDSLPRAYASLVETAARAHGLDPNLLLAVMSVESIYNRRIVSNAGAIGLMQIMPATGRRIAQSIGVDSFDATDLLDPRLNLDFSAWYLASLLHRFDGRLPLAIASYNGGPHNVRQWMLHNPLNMPLDVFLERIPFSETHRYVRRVLTHYAAYRAQEGLAVPRLSVELPARRIDETAF